MINVIIPAYKADEYIEHCLESAYRQTCKDLKVTVCVDGCQKTLEKLKDIQHKFKGLTVLYCKENKGTYITLNTMLSTLEDGYFLVFGADDKMHLNMVEEIMNVGSIGVVRSDGILFAPVKVVKELGGFMPWRCAGDSELVDRLKKSGYSIHRYRRMFTRGVHPEQVTKSKKYGLDSSIRKKYKKIINEDRPLQIEMEVNKYETIEPKKISFNVATYPPRIEVLKKVIECVRNKVDIVRVCLNEYEKIPDFLKGCEVVIPEKNLKDKGKFLWSKEHRNEIYFTGDDDLVYNDEYFEKHLEFLSCNNAIVSSHGRILRENAERLEDCKGYFPCLKDVSDDRQVDIAGTGAMAFDLSKFTVDLDNIPCEGMADIGLAIYAGRKNIPLVVREHSKMEYLLKDEETLWSQRNADKIRKLLKKIKPVDKIDIKKPEEFEGCIFEFDGYDEKVINVNPKNYPFGLGKEFKSVVKNKVKNIEYYLINREDDFVRYRDFQEQAREMGIKYKVHRPEEKTQRIYQIYEQEVARRNINKKEKFFKQVSNRLAFADIMQKSNGTTIIFEDDVYFKPEARQALRKILSELPEDFGVCYLGCYARFLEGKSQKYSESLIKLQRSSIHRIWGCHAVIYSEKAKEVLKDPYNGKHTLIMDQDVCAKILPNFDCFIADPQIAFQKDYGESMSGTFNFRLLEEKSLETVKNSIP